MGNIGQQWTTMDSNGQQSAVLHASVMPFLLLLAPVVFEEFRPSVEVARQIFVLRCIPDQQPFLSLKYHVLDGNGVLYCFLRSNVALSFETKFETRADPYDQSISLWYAINPPRQNIMMPAKLSSIFF